MRNALLCLAAAIYGMNSGIPCIKIVDRVEADVDLHGKRVSGPSLEFKQ